MDYGKCSGGPWQVIRTDRFGRITGDTYSDPKDAVLQFIYDNNNRGIYPKLILTGFNSTVVKFASDKIDYAVISNSTLGPTTSVDFLTNGSIGDINKYIDERRIPEGYTGRYHADLIIIDFKTGEVVGELHQLSERDKKEEWAQ